MSIQELSPFEEARTHLFTLFSAGLDRGEWLEMRVLDCRRDPSRFITRGYFRSVTWLVQDAMRYRDRYDIFFGVGLRRCPDVLQIAKCTHEKRGADHVSRLPAAWADFDIQSPDEPDKPHASMPELIKQLQQDQSPPTVLVASGTGIHAYWPFKKPMTDLRRVTRINSGIRKQFNGDNTIDAARILRLAGTLNFKHGKPLPVRLISVDGTYPHE